MGKCMRDIYELRVKRLRGCLGLGCFYRSSLTFFVGPTPSDVIWLSFHSQFP